MPASPQRRTRRVAPAEPVTDVPLPEDAPRPRSKSASQLRRVQSATANEKVRLPEAKRAAEVADGQLAAPLAGRVFRIESSVGLMPLMEWAVARAETDTTNGIELLALYHILKDIVHPDDWDEFCKHARESKCGDQEFADFQNAALEAIAARPTRAPATS